MREHRPEALRRIDVVINNQYSLPQGRLTRGTHRAGACLRRRRLRQPKHKLTAFAESVTVGRQYAPMQLRNAAGQAQSNTQASLDSMGGTRGLGEQLEDIGQ